MSGRGWTARHPYLESGHFCEWKIQCAIGCFQQAVVETTSCNPTDTACLCAGDNTVKIEKRASGCVAANCEDSSGKLVMDG